MGMETERSETAISYFKLYFNNKYTEISLNELINYADWEDKKLLLQSLVVGVERDQYGITFHYGNGKQQANALLKIDANYPNANKEYSIELKVDDRYVSNYRGSIKYEVRNITDSSNSKYKHLLVPDVPRYIEIERDDVLEVEISSFKRFVGREISLRFYGKDSKVVYDVPIILSPLINENSALILIIGHFNFLCVLLSIIPLMIIAIVRYRVKEKMTFKKFPNFTWTLVGCYALVCLFFHIWQFHSLDIVRHHIPILICSMAFSGMALFSYYKDGLFRQPY